ncbi:MAG: 2-isopropylmalate synthase [Oligoflexales bacterium]|nr:2-isopropylmalate synthase [Oligoflexales bacterium]
MENQTMCKKIEIFDTTLRDGQQCPGAAMSLEKNLEFASLAREFGVDVLEAGFPASSSNEFDVVYKICESYARFTSSPKVAALCQLRPEQYDVTMRSLEPLISKGRARLHTYLPVDPLLMASSLGTSAQNRKREMVEKLFHHVKMVVANGIEVQFSPEGYSRMGGNFDFTTDLIRAAVEGGAAVINCPDTVGGACRRQGSEFFVEHMKEHARIIEAEFPDRDITWSVHCHNDLGLALDNTMAAVFEGPATQVEGCINGIGERAGNVSIEQACMYIKQFGDSMDGDSKLETQINFGMIQEISNFVAENMLERQAHWPISGDNAARHTSGGHTNAILKNPLIYQAFDTRVIGKEIKLAFGPSSGGNHAKAIVEQHGYQCPDAEKAVVAQYIKSYYKHRYKGITDDELIHAFLKFRSENHAIEKTVNT